MRPITLLVGLAAAACTSPIDRSRNRHFSHKGFLSQETLLGEADAFTREIDASRKAMAPHRSKPRLGPLILLGQRALNCSRSYE